jgi:hypothetical protein
MLRLSFFLRVSEACHSSENMREVRTATDMLPPVQSSSGYGSTRPERSCRGSFASSGVWVYQEHLAMVRGLGLPRERLLEWTAADGWGPLCEFLGKDVPLEAFPQGNPTTEWVERTGAMMRESNRRAVRNMMIFGTVVVAAVSCIAYVIGFRA